MKKELVSIIVPVYNVEKYIKECLESIINQTYENIEVILIDDGSTDKSGRICDEYSKIDKRIKVIHKQNSGVSATRNIGLKEATGEYIEFVDPDDFTSKNYIKKMMDGIKNSDCVICGYNEQYKNATVSHSIAKHKCNIGRKEAINNLFVRNLYNGYLWNKLFKTNIIKEHQLVFNEKISILEDLLFVTEYLSYCNNITLITDNLYYYRMRKNSAINDFNSKKINNLFNGYMEINNVLQSKKICAPNYIYMLMIDLIKYKKNINLQLYMKKFNLKFNRTILQILKSKQYPMKLKIKLFIRKHFPYIYIMYINNKRKRYEFY